MTKTKETEMTEERWDGFMIVCDDGTLDEATMAAMEEWLDEHHPEYSWDVRHQRAREADGTYGKMDGRLPQILGYSVPVPEDVAEVIHDSFSSAIDTVNRP